MNKMIAFLLVLAWAATSAASSLSFPYVPNSDWIDISLCHPKDSHFKEYAYGQKIPKCNRKVSSGLKRRLYEAYGVPSKCRTQYTIDHFIPLSIGGSNQPENLWPENKKVKASRMDIEFEVYLRVKEGAMTQEEAIDIIVDEKLHPRVTDIDDDMCVGSGIGKLSRFELEMAAGF